MQREKNICVFCHFQFSGAYVYVWNEPSSICNLLSERRAAVSMKGMQITDFREQLCSQMLQFDDSTAATASFTASSSRHCLGTTTQKQSGKRPDRHLRKYCISCYEALKEQHGREIARKKAKRVITECKACNAHYCFACFPRYHNKLPGGPITTVRTSSCETVIECLPEELQDTVENWTEPSSGSWWLLSCTALIIDTKLCACLEVVNIHVGYDPDRILSGTLYDFETVAYAGFQKLVGAKWEGLGKDLLNFHLKIVHFGAFWSNSLKKFAVYQQNAP